MKLAGVIGVGVECGDGVESVSGGDADALPVQRRGDFKRDFGQRGFAVVAHGDEGAHGDFMFRGAQMHVHVEFGEGQGLALGVAGGDELPHHRVREGLRANLVAAGVALPFPAGVGRVAPAVGIGELKTLPLDRARGKAGVGVDALQSLQCGERFPGLSSNPFLMCHRITSAE